ncbi:hypothetical protein PITCH_A1920017 [uncultured Desulfobacterium sp.]|uniref:Uncharacterized protein n=1 Tax=uncultured Desulfobacterium sp. TaxID=201089 RepID=A0A445MW36_9BACT|nr:hypothetical protein PITCH_A1920017 [uncultured Desulfobacterium sp.]
MIGLSIINSWIFGVFLLTFKNQFYYKCKLVFFRDYQSILMLESLEEHSAQISDLIINDKDINYE